MNNLHFGLWRLEHRSRSKNKWTNNPPLGSVRWWPWYTAACGTFRESVYFNQSPTVVRLFKFLSASCLPSPSFFPSSCSFLFSHSLFLSPSLLLSHHSVFPSLINLWIVQILKPWFSVWDLKRGKPWVATYLKGLIRSIKFCT